MLDKPAFPYGAGFRSLTEEIAYAGRALRHRHAADHG